MHLIREGVRLGIRTMAKQKTRARERIPGRARRDTRIAKIKQRIPTAWSTALHSQAGIAVEMLPQCRRHVHKPRGSRQNCLRLVSPPNGRSLRA